ncbi:MAG TPA: hypothetical protein VMW17_08835 [Candidatus Binatia bacterium]|nr:hypothetical protein [Candidatus Binatia bacterium]
MIGALLASLLGLVALAAAVILGWRRLRTWRRETTRRGQSEASAISVTDYGEIDAVVLHERCRCGGRFSVRGEGSRGFVRIVHLECHLCGRERKVYFDVRGVRH